MSLETASTTPAPEASTAAAEMPTIQLSFSSGPGGAWDDRELINAANSAMKEFHVHHPGPGSWLDKATAAMAAGKPLPGANDFGTSWYTASNPSQPVATDAADPTPTPYVPPKKKQRTNRPKKVYGPVNPYDPVEYTANSRPGASGGTSAWGVARKGDGAVAQAGRAASPSYMPVSPGEPFASGDELGDDEEVGLGLEGGDEDEEWQEELEGEAGDWQVEDYPAQAPAPYPQAGAAAGPAYGVYPPAGITHEAALGHAMTAQYWAGYWMGVAQATQHAGPVSGAKGKGKRQRREDESAGDGGEGQGEVPSNVVVTRQQFGADASGLRR
ncbi:hypothetical protein IAT38_004614 [Cryptococcus sp. DSM 104549]